MNKLNKSKSALVFTLTSMFLMLIAFVFFSFLFDWTNLFANQVERDYVEISSFDENSIEPLSLKNESGNIYMYVRNFDAINYNITKLQLNENDCIIPSSGIYIGPYNISRIQMNCSVFNTSNKIFILTAGGGIDVRLKIE